MEGLIIPDFTKGIDDHAYEIVRQTIKKITELTKCNTLVPIGHSMGGMIAAFYAENIAEEENIMAEHVFMIGSPAKGTPTPDFIWAYISDSLRRTKRHE